MGPVGAPSRGPARGFTWPIRANPLIPLTGQRLRLLQIFPLASVLEWEKYSSLFRTIEPVCIGQTGEPMSAAEKPSPSGDVAAIISEFDRKFLEFYQAASTDTIDKARVCTDKVFELSSTFMNKDTTQVLRKFQELYFGNKKVEARKEKINQEVDDLIDQIQDQMDQGGEVKVVAEDEAARTERLGLAGLQKKLEGLITLDEGIREKIVPAVSSMQFEDAVRQRLDHINQMWGRLAGELLGESTPDLRQLGEQLAAMCSSVEETADFYKIILKEDPPAGGVEQGAAFLF